MKMAESLGIVLVSNIIDIDDMQVSTRTVFLNLNTCKVMIFFKFWPDNIEKTVTGIEIQAKLYLSNLHIVKIDNMGCLDDFSQIQPSS